MKRVLLLFIMITPLLLIAQNIKNIDPFTSLDVSTNITVDLVEADDYRLEYKMIKGDAEGLVISQSGNNLKITTKNKGRWTGSNVKAKITLYTPRISSIDASAGSSVSSRDVFQSDAISLESSSGASINVKLEANSIEGSVSSGGSIVVTGKSDNTKIEASSGGSFNGIDLETKNAKAESSSGGSVKIWCTQDIVADASSGGSIRYKGNPSKTNIDAGFSGSIGKM